MSGSKTVYRQDFMQLRGKSRLTSQGFLRVPAALTKAGILTYRTKSGKEIKELRHPDDVFAPSSMKSLEAAPVIAHNHIPNVNSSNYKDVQVGMVSERLDRDGDLLTGELIIQDADVIRQINSGELKELSPGYRCVIDPTPGEYNGERYDQRQTCITYNHECLGRSGWGRSGPEVSLRLDGLMVEAEESSTNINQGEKTMKLKIRLDGRDFEVDVSDAVAADFLQAVQKDELARADSKDAIESLAETVGKVAALEQQLKETQARLDSATDPKNLEKAAKARADVLEVAKKHLSDEIRLDSLSVDEIKTKVVEANGTDLSGIDEKLRPAAIQGAFAVIQARKETRVDSLAMPVAAPIPMQKRQDSEKKRNSFDARKEMLKRNQNAWKEAK